jgi:hypothetical protein
LEVGVGKGFDGTQLVSGLFLKVSRVLAFAPGKHPPQPLAPQKG